LEDIRKDYEEERYRRSKDRILWSTINCPNGVNRMGNRTHKDSLMKKTFKDFAEACWDTHKQVGFKMKGGKRVPNCVPKNEEEIPVSLYDLSELGPAAMKRRARMRARMGILQKKYSDARKAGIHPSKVSQRHNKMTVKKR
jgi:hypothetical protein